MTQIKKLFVSSVLVLFVVQPLLAQLPLVKPELVSVSSSQLALMDAVITESITQKKLPGAVVLVGRKGKIVWRKAYGARAVEPSREGACFGAIASRKLAAHDARRALEHRRQSADC